MENAIISSGPQKDPHLQEKRWCEVFLYVKCLTPIFGSMVQSSLNDDKVYIGFLGIPVSFHTHKQHQEGHFSEVSQ